jgi:hypothetical protein
MTNPIDNTKFYLFHNIYGDAQELIDTSPNNVVPIPFGWVKSVEEYRNLVLNEMNTSIGELPAVCFWLDQYEYTRFDEEYQKDVIETIPAHWETLNIPRHINKPWTWDKINETIQNWDIYKTTNISSSNNV